MKRRDAVILGIVALLAGGAPARAEGAYPDRPVRIVVDSAAGSANDFTARTLADKLGKLWGQQVLILNQPRARAPRRLHALSAGALGVPRRTGRSGRRAEPADRAAARFRDDRLRAAAA